MLNSLDSKDFRDYLFNRINSQDHSIMCAEAELSETDPAMVTIYRARSGSFIEVTPVYTPLIKGSSTIDLVVNPGKIGVYAPDFSKFLEVLVNSDQIFSSGNSLYDPLGVGTIERCKQILKRVPILGEPRMVCAIQTEINTDQKKDSLMSAFYDYMSLPVLYYLYHMGEFSKQ